MALVTSALFVVLLGLVLAERHGVLADALPAVPVGRCDYGRCPGMSVGRGIVRHSDRSAAWPVAVTATQSACLQSRPSPEERPRAWR